MQPEASLRGPLQAAGIHLYHAAKHCRWPTEASTVTLMDGLCAICDTVPVPTLARAILVRTIRTRKIFRDVRVSPPAQGTGHRRSPALALTACMCIGYRFRCGRYERQPLGTVQRRTVGCELLKCGHTFRIVSFDRNRYTGTEKRYIPV